MFLSLTSWLYDTRKMCLKFEEIVKKQEVSKQNLTEKKGYAKVFERILWNACAGAGKPVKWEKKAGGEMLWF